MRLTALAVSLLLYLLCLPVSAQTTSFEVWGATEFQLNLSPEAGSFLDWNDLLPNRLRIYTEQQFAHDIGLQQASFRLGPIWNPLPGFSLAAHVSSVAFPTSEQDFGQETRFELEPSFKGQLLGLHWSNRHRLEYRLRPQRQFWRYRTRLALHYPLPGSPWTPFVSNELHFEPGAGFQQNRLLLGLSCQLSPSTQLSLSYLNRLVLNHNQWTPENGLMLSLIYTSQDEGLFQSQAD